MAIDWTYEHFIAYIYLSIAGSDYSIDQEELSQIGLKVNESIQNNAKSKEIVKAVRADISGKSDREITAFIEENVGKFLPEKADRDKVIEGMEDIIVADDNVDSTEMVMFRFVKKALRG